MNIAVLDASSNDGGINSFHNQMETNLSTNSSPIFSPDLNTFHIPMHTSTILVMLNISIVSNVTPPLSSPNDSFNQSVSSKINNKAKMSNIDPTIRMVWLLFGPTIFVVGVCGNIFVLIIMTRKIMGGTSTCVHLSMMAIADLTVTLIGLTPEWFEICFDSAFKNIHPATCKIEKFFFYTAADVSVWMLAIFTLDRYVAVCHPLKKKVVCTTKRARYFAAIAVTVAVAKNVHVFWTRGIQYGIDNVNKQLFVRKLCGTTDPTYEYFESYVRSWLVFIFVNGLPAIIISICNFFIAKSMLSIGKKSCNTPNSIHNFTEISALPLHRQISSPLQLKETELMKLKKFLAEDHTSFSSLNLSRHSIATPADQYLQIPGGKHTNQNRYVTQTSLSLPRNKSHHQPKTLAVSSTQSINNKALVQMTAMCLAASVCFLVCNTPSVVLYVGREYWEKNEGYYVFKPLYNIFVYVNHAINFILYCLTGQRFRRVFLDFFCSGFQKDRHVTSRRYSDWGDNSVNLTNIRPISRRTSLLDGDERHCNNARRNTSVGSKNFLDEIEEI